MDDVKWSFRFKVVALNDHPNLLDHAMLHTTSFKTHQEYHRLKGNERWLKREKMIDKKTKELCPCSSTRVNDERGEAWCKLRILETSYDIVEVYSIRENMIEDHQRNEIWNLKRDEAADKAAGWWFNFILIFNIKRNRGKRVKQGWTNKKKIKVYSSF